MPHVDITMIPGRNVAAKMELAQKTQQFIAHELSIDERFVSVSIEDVPKEAWATHMDSYDDKTMFVKPGV